MLTRAHLSGWSTCGPVSGVPCCALTLPGAIRLTLAQLTHAAAACSGAAWHEPTPTTRWARRFGWYAGSDGAPEHTDRECEREASYRQWFQCVPCRCTSSRSCNDGLQTTGLLAGTTPDEVRGGRHEQRGDGRLTKHHRVMSFGRQEGRFFYQTKAWKRPKQRHRSKGELRQS